MSRKRIRAPISFGVASVCVAACSSMNPLTKPSIQSTMEAEELIAPVEVATELQGIDAVPVSKAGGPADGSPDREAGGAGGSGNIDPVTGQAKISGQNAPGAAGGVTGKNGATASGVAGAGARSGSQTGAAAQSLTNSPTSAQNEALKSANGKISGQGVAGVKGVNPSVADAGTSTVIGASATTGAGADAVAVGASGVGGGDAVSTASGSGDLASVKIQDQGGSGTSVSNPLLANRGPASADGARIIEYRVKEGDTLMKIAFEVFGDLTRWREIHDLNKEWIGDPNVLTKGTRLRIKVFNVRTVSRNGEAYLIKRGDTLRRISQWVYGTVEKWKKLWENNRELISDPNRIFAGFKLYFVRDQDPKRVPASNPAAPPENDSRR